jgi:hypothetical protein
VSSRSTDYRELLYDTVEVKCDRGTAKVQWDGISDVVFTESVEPLFAKRSRIIILRKRGVHE